MRRNIFSGNAHVVMIDGAKQPFAEHRIHQFGIAHGRAAPRAEQQVRCQTHAFLPPGNDNPVVLITNGLISQMHGFQAAAAHFIDIQAGDFDGQAGVQCRGAGGILAGTGRQYLTQNHLINLIRLDAGFLQQRLDDLGAQHVGGNGRKRTHEVANRGASRSDDDHVFHQVNLQKVINIICRDGIFEVNNRSCAANKNHQVRGWEIQGFDALFSPGNRKIPVNLSAAY